MYTHTLFNALIELLLQYSSVGMYNIEELHMIYLRPGNIL